MKQLSFMVFIVILFPAALWGQASGRAIKQYGLDERMVYKVKVPGDKGTTTLMFPGALEGVAAGKRSALDAGAARDFVVGYKDGGTFLTVRAKHPKASDVLTIFFNNKAYIVELEAVDKAPDFAVYFYSLPAPGASGGGVSPAVVANLLNTAKAYSVLSRHQPEAVAGVGYARPARIMFYNGFKVLIEEVFRFDKEDTLVFNITLQNDTLEPISYKRNDFAVRVGDRIYNQSLSQASGTIPPGSPSASGLEKLSKGESLTDRDIVPGLSKVFFAITGTPDGGRNNLLPGQNAWNILVVRVQPEIQSRIEEEKTEEEPLPKMPADANKEEAK
ncbi:MAG: hypothetical protein SFY92_00690 [Verrucomicrobiae bacterium]|nr:hypothetical protein [Verrucomicrobiae bacterium]